MRVRIQVFNVRHSLPHRGPMIQARAFSESGQIVINGPILDGNDLQIRTCAMSDICSWIRANRPKWEIT